MTDILTIFLNDIIIFGHHGVFDQERVVGNEFRLNLNIEIFAPIRACCSDELQGTISYADLYDVVREEFAIPSALLEHVGWRILEHIHSTWPEIKSAEITIEKLAPPIPGLCGTAGIRLNRSW